MKLSDYLSELKPNTHTAKEINEMYGGSLSNVYIVSRRTKFKLKWSKRGRKFDSKRNEQIFELRRTGNTLESIGQAFGISRQRIEQLCSKYKVVPLVRVHNRKDSITYVTWNCLSCGISKTTSIHMVRRFCSSQCYGDSVRSFEANPASGELIHKLRRYDKYSWGMIATVIEKDYPKLRKWKANANQRTLYVQRILKKWAKYNNVDVSPCFPGRPKKGAELYPYITIRSLK